MSMRELLAGAGSSRSSADTAFKRVLCIYESEVFTAGHDMSVVIHAVGGGGSGGAGYRVMVTGGGAGGYALKRAKLSIGEKLTITIGAGGVNSSSSGLGVPGGNTTVIGPNINLTARGGMGGLTSSNYQYTVSGGIGGIAEGGDLNFQGGHGGSIFPAKDYHQSATGGGAVNVGAGDTSAPSISPTSSSASRGGHIAKQAPDRGVVAPSLRLAPGVEFNRPTPLPFPVMGFLKEIGPYETDGKAPGPGCGSAGRIGNDSYFGVRAGLLAGGGGLVSTQSQIYRGCHGVLGGGGGGSSPSTYDFLSSGTGGAGFVVLEVYEWQA